MVTTGETYDISNLCRFGFYQWVYYWDKKHKFPVQKKRIGRALWPTKNEGIATSQYILEATDIVVPRQMVKAVPPEHLRNQVLQDKMKVYESCIKEKLGDRMHIPVDKGQHKPQEWIPYEDDETKPHTTPENEICLDTFNAPLIDSLINAQVLLHQEEADDGQSVKDQVIRHLPDENENLISQANKKINMNTLMYEVEFMDGERAPYAANVITQEIYSSVDPEGRRDILIEEIVDYAQDFKYAVKKGCEFFFKTKEESIDSGLMQDRIY